MVATGSGLEWLVGRLAGADGMVASDAHGHPSWRDRCKALKSGGRRGLRKTFGSHRHEIGGKEPADSWGPQGR